MGSVDESAGSEGVPLIRWRRWMPFLALGLVVLLYRRRETLSAEAWSELRE